MTSKVNVVGIGDDGASGLSPDARKLIDDSTHLVGGERHLGFFPSYPGKKIVVRGSMAKVLEEIPTDPADGNRVVVLASGDPLFYGIARFVISRFGKDRVAVLPAVSSMQLAFARVLEPWEDAVLVSCHAKPIENVISAARDARKLGIFTDEKNSPSAIALALRNAGLAGFRAYVCENLGGADENIYEGPVDSLVGKEFSPLNVLILLSEEERLTPSEEDYPFGVPEEYFDQKRPRRGLITKWEIRSVSLARLELRHDSVVWDVGAGSGSLSVEAARLAPAGHVYAIEKDEDDARIVENNRERFRAPNVTVVHGKAPVALKDLPDPDAVFIGGSGGEAPDIVREAHQRLKPGGRLVANVATLENLDDIVSALRELGENPHISHISVARSKTVLDLTAFEALNPVYVVYVRKSKVK